MQYGAIWRQFLAPPESARRLLQTFFFFHPGGSFHGKGFYSGEAASSGEEIFTHEACYIPQNRQMDNNVYCTDVNGMGAWLVLQPLFELLTLLAAPEEL